MADRTEIEWADATWNPIRGCARVSEGCRHCYAERQAGRWSGEGQPYEGLVHLVGTEPRWTGAVTLVGGALEAPRRWQRRRRVFVDSMGDLFFEPIPDGWIDRIFAVMWLAPQHTFIILTKRQARMRAYLSAPARPVRIRQAAETFVRGLRLRPGDPMPWPLPNVQLGVSCENQATADERIPDLLATPAAVRIVSAEPLLGPVDLTGWLPRPAGWKWYPVECRHGRDLCPICDRDHHPFLDGVIVGGESGPAARPMHPNWARSLRGQCGASGVPFFFKQWGEWAPGESASHAATRTERTATWFDGRWDFGSLTPRQSEETHADDAPDLYWFGKRRAGRHLDGRTHDDLAA